ncbi:MAG TPA: 4-(cytidine 5'-diphospho)-2-C-methyl-D-erythritol kinase [Vicinamibacterales bacterium]|nr:4-(cytidine 5'-diphospho)-2-C-methyl-D-erythritol kinase [Vicinamibacterales bacterium]
MASVTLRAFAKINLSLRVQGVRADGFHEVQTILQTIDLFDRVTCATWRGSFEIRCMKPGVPTDRTNLVWIAARYLWRAGGRDGQPRDAYVALEKNIPMQAGLGGGSSNAAAALLGLRRIWKLRVANDELAAIAAQIGSDVPYFLVGGTALGLGRGDEVYPLEELPRLWVVLVLPPFGVATKDAYEWLDAQETRPPSSGQILRGFPTPLTNDLEAPVIERHPIINRLKTRLRAEGAVLAAMSGSGSTVFGVFTAERSARAAARKLEKSGADVRWARFQRRARA